MVGIFEDHHWEYGFVGRVEKLEEAQDAWNKEDKQIFGIYGYKSYGKSRFGKEIVLRQGVTEGNLYQLDFSGITSLSEMVIHVVNAIGTKEPYHERNWIPGVCSCLSKRVGLGEKDIVLFIDNVEIVDEVEEMKSAFLQLCEKVIEVSRLVKVIFLSSLKFRFASVSKVYKAIELQPLSSEESRKLLREVVDGMDLCGQEDKIIELCSGLPLALMMAGSELNEDEGQLKPAELVTLLETSRLNPMSREHYGEDERMVNVIGGAISRLCGMLQQHYASVNYIPGSFTKGAAAAVSGFDNNAQAMDEAIIPLSRRCLVAYDGQTERFDINAMQREFVMNNIRIKDMPGVRTRFCQFYSQCLIQLQKTVDSKDSGQALVPINMELKNFKKLLEKAADCSGDGTYDVFMQAATEANYLIQFYMPERTVSFYEVMLDMTQEHGSEFETGVLMSILGEAVSENKGDYKGGMDLYWKAEQKLLPFGNSRRLAEVYQHIGWHYYTNGNGDEAVKYHMKSYHMLKALKVEEDLQLARILNCLGVAYVLIGKAKEAEKYHLKGLAMRLRLVGEKHLNIATQYNNVGLMYELKEDYENAIMYFEKSYKLKLEILGPSKTVIISMRNLGLQWVREGEYQKALDLVQENLDTFDQVLDVDQTSLANILKVQGTAYLGMEKYGKAENYLRQLMVIQKRTIPGHRTLMKTFTQLSQSLRMQGQLDEAEVILQEAYGLKSAAITCRGKFLFETLHEFAQLYLASGDLQKACSFFSEALSELHRVGDQLIRETDEHKSKSITIEMGNLLKEIDKVECLERVAVPQPCNMAHNSCCLRTFSDIVYGNQSRRYLNSSESVSLINVDQTRQTLDLVGRSSTLCAEQPPQAAPTQLPSSRTPYWTTGHVYPSYVSRPFDLDGTNANDTGMVTPQQETVRQLSYEVSDNGNHLNGSACSTDYFADTSTNDQCLPSNLDSWIIEQQTVLNTSQVSMEGAQTFTLGGPPTTVETCLPSNIGSWLDQHSTTTTGSEQKNANPTNVVINTGTDHVNQCTNGKPVQSISSPSFTVISEDEETGSVHFPPRHRTASDTNTVFSEDLYLGASDTEESFMKSLETRGNNLANSSMGMRNDAHPYAPLNTSAISPTNTSAIGYGHPPAMRMVTTAQCNTTPSHDSTQPRNPYRKTRMQTVQSTLGHNQLLQHPPDGSWHPPQTDHSRAEIIQNAYNSSLESVLYPLACTSTVPSCPPGQHLQGCHPVSPSNQIIGELHQGSNHAIQTQMQGGSYVGYSYSSNQHSLSQTAVKSLYPPDENSLQDEGLENGSSSSLLDSFGSWFSGGKAKGSKVQHL